MKHLICPKCGNDMILRNGKYGQFYGCTSFPRCKKTLDKKKAHYAYPATSLKTQYGDDTVVLTKAILDENATARGGYTKAQARALGLNWPLKKGWKKNLIGKRISKLSLKCFIDGKQRGKCSNNAAETTLRLRQSGGTTYPNHLRPLYGGDVPPWDLDEYELGDDGIPEEYRNHINEITHT